MSTDTMVCNYLKMKCVYSCFVGLVCWILGQALSVSVNILLASFQVDKTEESEESEIVPFLIDVPARPTPPEGK
jgi:hypothetical protein